jgi:hypothetical protein
MLETIEQWNRFADALRAKRGKVTSVKVVEIAR